MSLPRKDVIDRQAAAIRETFESVDDTALQTLNGGQPRYGLVLAPPKNDPPQPAPGTPTTPGTNPAASED
jgi:hypothetical protein